MDSIDFKLAKFIITVDFQSNVHLGEFKGSALRGTFGHSLKQLCCIFKRKLCKNCKVGNKCLYYTVFESKTEKEHFYYGRLGEKPRPYLFSFDKFDRHPVVEKNKPFEFSFTIFNHYIEAFPVFLYSIILMGNRGMSNAQKQFNLKKIEVENINRERKSIYKNGFMDKINKDDIITFQKIRQKNLKIDFKNKKKLAVNFITPLRLKRHGKFIRNIDFRIFLTAVIRRISLVLFYYSGVEKFLIDLKKLDTEKIKEQKKEIQWYDWRRYSNRQGSYMKFGGIIGEEVFDLNGFNIEKVYDFIKLAEYLNIGKNCTFGLGKIKTALGDGG